MPFTPESPLPHCRDGNDGVFRDERIQPRMNMSRSRTGEVRYYLRENECIDFYNSNELQDKKSIISEWKNIEQNEKFGNKELGIRGRHDASVRTNITIPMPNHYTAEMCIEKTKEIIAKTPIKNCHYTIAVHRGEAGEVAKNLHVHLIVNERNKITRKKDRELNHRDFPEQLREQVRKTINHDFKNQIKTVSQLKAEKTERIPMMLWKASPGQVRQSLILTRFQMDMTIDALRNKPLPDVLKALGADLDPADKYNWKTPDGGRISLDKKNAFKWYDHNKVKGGGGAIDLVMHLQKCNFKTAMNTLMNLPATELRPPEIVKEKTAEASALPSPDESKWPNVKKYLVEQRKLDARLIDAWHANGIVFSDNLNNACFLSNDKKGCELRGTGESNYHGYRGVKSGFALKGGDEKKIAYVESSIDVMSLVELGFKGTVVTFCGQAINYCIASAKELLLKGYSIIAAFDNDESGQAMSRKMKEVLPQTTIAVPKDGSKDWNTRLQTLRATQTKNITQSTPKVKFVPKTKKNGHGGHGFGMGM